MIARQTHRKHNWDDVAAELEESVRLAIIADNSDREGLVVDSANSAALSHLVGSGYWTAIQAFRADMGFMIGFNMALSIAGAVSTPRKNRKLQIRWAISHCDREFSDLLHGRSNGENLNWVKIQNALRDDLELDWELTTKAKAAPISASDALAAAVAIATKARPRCEVDFYREPTSKREAAIRSALLDHYVEQRWDKNIRMLVEGLSTLRWPSDVRAALKRVNLEIEKRNASVLAEQLEDAERIVDGLRPIHRGDGDDEE